MIFFDIITACRADLCAILLTLKLCLLYGLQDVKSYLNVGIPESRIFTVNHKVPSDIVWKY